MTLSNTAVPTYYGQFREAVINGHIPICEEIALEMERIDELIENPAMYYDNSAIDGFIEFCEAEMTLVNGDELRLLDSFKLWAESLLSWFYFDTRSVYVPSDGDHGGRYEIGRAHV